MAVIIYLLQQKTKEKTPLSYQIIKLQLLRSLLKTVMYSQVYLKYLLLRVKRHPLLLLSSTMSLK